MAPETLHGPAPALGRAGGEAGWFGIWQEGRRLGPVSRQGAASASQPLLALTLVVEFVCPPSRGRRPLRLWQGAAGVSRGIALYATGEGRLRLVHGEIDLATPEDFARRGEAVSLRYVTCARGRGDVADFVNHDRELRFRQRAGLAHAARADEALPGDPRYLDVCHVAAVAGFGLPGTDLPALAAGTVLQGAEGPVPVERLRPGDLLVTATGTRLPVRWVERRPRLCLGRAAPVRLRAPYFGLERDLCVSPDTRVMRSGPVVEYNFGHERVLVRAGDLTASPGVQRDTGRPVRDVLHLMFDDHACIAIDRCGVETALLSDVVAAEAEGLLRNLALSDRTPCLPVLDRAAARALVAATAKGRGALS